MTPPLPSHTRVYVPVKKRNGGTAPGRVLHRERGYYLPNGELVQTKPSCTRDEYGYYYVALDDGGLVVVVHESEVWT